MQDLSWVMIDLLPEPILLVSIEGNVVMANRSARRFFARTPCQATLQSSPYNFPLQGLPLTELVSTDPSRVKHWLKIWNRSSTVIPGSLMIPLPDGTEVKIELDAVALRQCEMSLILLRFWNDRTFLSKFIDLTVRVNQLDQEIARQKTIEAQLRLRQQELESQNDQLQDLAQHDSLTGLPNRRVFETALASAWDNAMRSQKVLAVMMLDVDHFKIFNDTYGHLAGDLCLRQVASTIKAQVREGRDLAARFGGEEFVILLQNCDLERADRVANRVLQSVRHLKIPHCNAPTQPFVTLSAGVCTIMPTVETQTPVGLIHGADQALYCAKQEGRDRFVLGTLSPHAMSHQLQREMHSLTGP